MHFGYAFVSPYIRCPIISTFTLFVLGFSHFCTWTLLYGGPLFLFFSSIMHSSYDLTLYFIFLFLYSYLFSYLLIIIIVNIYKLPCFPYDGEPQLLQIWPFCTQDKPTNAFGRPHIQTNVIKPRRVWSRSSIRLHADRSLNSLVLSHIAESLTSRCSSGQRSNRCIFSLLSNLYLRNTLHVSPDNLSLCIITPAVFNFLFQ